MSRRSGQDVRVALIAGVVVLVIVSTLLVIRLRDAGEPHGGLAEADAIAAARAETNGAATGVISADVRHDFASAPLGHVVRAHPWAWVITFQGRWELLCDASPDRCVVTTEWVAVDYYTGVWIASQYAYPAGG